MTPAERALAASIRQTLGSAYEAVSKLEKVLRAKEHPDADPGEISEEEDEKEQTLTYYVEKLFRDTRLLAERLGAHSMIAQIDKRIPEDGKATDLQISPDGDMYSPHIWEAVKFFESLEALTDGKDVTGLNIFETILESTPKIIAAFNLNPRNEKEVRDAVRTALGFAFHDTVREVPLPKSIKTYQPDLAVISLRAAAEYKFIDSLADAKRALDESYTDMKGYAGTFEWRHFYAVYYMTDTFFTQRQIEAEYKLVGAERNWTPLVVVGKGARRPK